MTTRTCNICKIEKYLEIEFSKNKTMSGGREYQCKVCRKILYKKRMQDPQIKKQKLEQTRLYKKSKTFKRHRNSLEKNRRNIDLQYRMIGNLRSRCRKAFLGFYKDKTTKKLLGCSLQELQDHIMSQFQFGMTMHNYGEWHLDHIIPLSSAKDKTELEILCHYTNLQPLWAIDNLIKSNKR